MPQRATSLPAALKASLHKRTDSATRLPSYDSVQSLQTLELLAEETKVRTARATHAERSVGLHLLSLRSSLLSPHPALSLSSLDRSHSPP